MTENKRWYAAEWPGCPLDLPARAGILGPNGKLAQRDGNPDVATGQASQVDVPPVKKGGGAWYAPSLANASRAVLRSIERERKGFVG